MYFSKLIKIGGVLLFMALVSCKKEVYQHGNIDLSFSDEYAGMYDAVIIRDPGPGYYLGQGVDTIYTTIEIVDLRTETENEFYIDYVEEDFFVKPNGDFYEEVGTMTKIFGSIRNDSLFLWERIEDNYWPHNWLSIRARKL